MEENPSSSHSLFNLFILIPTIIVIIHNPGVHGGKSLFGWLAEIGRIPTLLGWISWYFGSTSSAFLHLITHPPTARWNGMDLPILLSLLIKIITIIAMVLWCLRHRWLSSRNLRPEDEDVLLVGPLLILLHHNQCQLLLLKIDLWIKSKYLCKTIVG